MGVTSTPRTCIQVYDLSDKALIAETTIDGIFKVLGYDNGSYIGVQLIPDEESGVCIYRFKVK